MNKNSFRMENLKKIREKRKITQVKLSTEIEVSQELISQYEIGKSKPNVDNLLKLSDYFNCSTDYLLERTNNSDPIKKLNLQESEFKDMFEKYKLLSSEKKKYLLSYLNYLLNQ